MEPTTLKILTSSVSLEVDGATTLSVTVKDTNSDSIHVDQNNCRGGLIVHWETSNDEKENQM